MKTVNFGKCITLFSLTWSMALASASALDYTPTSSVDECSRELLLSYFPETFVNETLKKNNVPKDQWDAINKELSSKNDSVIKLVEEKAQKMDPNPLKDPSQRQAAVKIFRDTLFEVFSGVMKQHGVTDDQQIRAMLDDIQHQKAVRFAQCMDKNFPKQAATQQAQQPQAPADKSAESPAGTENKDSTKTPEDKNMADAAEEAQKQPNDDENKDSSKDSTKTEEDKFTAYGSNNDFNQQNQYYRNPSDTQQNNQNFGNQNQPQESIHSIVDDVDDTDDSVNRG